MPIIVTDKATGREVEFPDGTDRGTIKRVLSRKKRPDVPKGDYLEFATQSGIGDKEAEVFKDATVNRLAFGLPEGETLKAKPQIDLALSHNPTSMQTKVRAESVFNSVSTLGAAWQYPKKPEHVQLPSDRLEPEEVLAYAELYRDRELITEEEYQKVLDSKNPGKTLFNIDAVYTESYPPLPKHFYDKTLKERIKEAPKAFAGGVNDSLSGFFRGLQWLEGEAGVSVGSKSVADWLQENAQIAQRGIRADIGTDLWGAVGSMSTLVLPAAGAGKVVRFAGLTERMALSLEMGTATVGESLMESGGVYQEIIERGGSINEANKGARITFASNIPLLAISNKLGLYKARVDAVLDAQTASTTKRLGRAAVEGFTGEFVQGAGQEVIGQVAKDEPIDLDKIAYAGFLEGVIGLGTSVLMSQASQKIDEIPEMSPELEATYDRVVEEGLQNGLTDEQAHIEATREIAKTEEGQEILDKTMQAQEAVMKAEASMGTLEDVPLSPEVQRFEDVIQRLEEGQITEEQAILELEDRLTARPTVELTTENIGEVASESSIAPRVPAFESVEPVRKDELVPELTSMDSLRNETFLTGQKEYWATPDIVKEAIVEAENTNPGQPKGVIYRGMSLEQVENGVITLDSVQEHRLDKDPTQNIKAVWATSSYQTAVQRAREHGENGIVIAIPTEVLPDNLYVQNASLTEGNIEEVWVGIPASIRMDNVQIQTLNEALTNSTEDVKMEIRRREYDTSTGIGERRTEAEQLRGEGRTVLEPREVEGVPEVSGVEPTSTGRPLEAGQAPQGRGEQDALLGEEGLIDLNSEISLRPILERLSEVSNNPPQALEDITSLGRSIFNEGRTTLQDFTARMKEILGDLWESFKNVARRAWEIVNNERGSIEFGPSETPIYDVRFNLENIRFQMKHGNTNPAFMEENESWTEEEVIRAIEKAEKGRNVTEREAEIVHAALAEAGANFYQEVMTSEDDFINPKDFIEEGELQSIIETKTKEFVNNLKIVTPVTLTAEQKTKKERTKRIRRQSKEIQSLQKSLEEQAYLLHQSVLDQHRIRLRSKQETKEAQKDINSLKSKIETRDAKIQAQREKINSDAKTARAFVKGLSGVELARTRAAEAKGTPSQREAIKVALQAARKAFSEGRREGVVTEAQRLRDIFETARGKREDTTRRNKLRKQIKKLLKTTKAKKEGGKPVGKFTPEIQRILDKLREAANMNPIEALTRINDNLARAKDEIPTDEVALENRIISMVHDFGSRTVPQLETLLEDIRGLVEEGRMINELKKFNRQAQNEKNVIEAVDVISGGKGLPHGATSRIRKTNYEKVIGVTDRAKRWFSTTGKTIVGWNDILDILSRLDKSKPFESRLNKLGDVLDVKNAEKQGLRDTTEEIQRIFRESYGIPLEGRAADRQAIKKIQEDTKPIDLGTFTDLRGNSVTLEITRAEARKRYMEFQDPTLTSTFVEGMAYTEEMMSAITETLTPEDKVFAQAQLDFYQRYYEGINEIYADIYGTYLPKNEFYSPIRREGYEDTNTGFGEFLQNINFGASVAPGSVKSRTKNILPIRESSDLSILEQHMTEMEHFKAWGSRIRELRAIFNDSEVKAAIEVYHDPNINGVIDNFMKDFARGGVDQSKKMSWIDTWRSNIARSVLAVKPSIGFKQLTSFIAYADAMPVTDFVKGTVEFWKNPIDNSKFIYENSTLLANRGQNIERDIKDAQRTDAYKAWRKGQSFLNALMLNIHIGDQGAIVMGGWPLINYHMKQGKSVKEAMEIFERVTESTQQSADLSDLSVWQRGGSFAKLFTLYRSSPNQYVRKEIAAIRNLFAGRQTVAQTAKTITIFHILLPMLFQFVSDGFTWDEEEQKRAVVFGPLNGIFIVGDILEGITRSALGMRDFDEEIPMMSLKDDVKKTLPLITEDEITDEEFLRAVRGLASGVGSVTGVPLKTFVDVGEGVDEILTGDFERGAAQVLGYSPSVADKIAEE